jgi:phospholipase/carboxylesterase
MSPMGRQWFALSNRRPDDPAGADDRWAGVVKARPGLDAFLDAELARAGLDESRLALVGFSQGAMMALHVGLRRKRAPAAIVGYSGLLIGSEHLGEAKARDARGAPPPILLVHGDQDPVIPLEALFVSSEDLAKAEIPTQWHLSIGVGHGIDNGGLRHGGLFIAKGFGLRVR